MRRQPFATLETLVVNHANTVSGCICVMLAWDEPRQKFVEKLQMLDLPVVVVVIRRRARRNRSISVPCVRPRNIFMCWKWAESKNNWQNCDENPRTSKRWSIAK